MGIALEHDKKIDALTYRVSELEEKVRILAIALITNEVGHIPVEDEAVEEPVEDKYEVEEVEDEEDEAEEVALSDGVDPDVFAEGNYT